MNSDEVFLRAALYEECSKSSILKHVEIETSSTETLRELLNKNNSLVFRKVPIILSKLVVKHGLQFVKSKMPQLSFLTPEQISVSVESDEMQYLLQSQSAMKPNLVLIVSKNILMSVVGSSIRELQNELLGSSENGETQSYKKIPIGDIHASTWSKVETPKLFTNTFEPETENITNTFDRDSQSPLVRSRRTSVSSNKSFKSTSSSMSTARIRKAKNVATYVIPSLNDRKHLLIETTINDLEHSTQPKLVNIVENIRVKSPDPPLLPTSTNDKFDDPTSPMGEYDEDNDEEVDVDDARMDDEPVKLSELHETPLNSKAVDFYSLIAADDNQLDERHPPKPESTEPIEVIDIEEGDEIIDEVEEEEDNDII
uniref:GrBNV_gp67-like protein n=1 Tax=Oryctes rhinoceros nudivirus TaxID=92521 RepID=A0A6B9QSD0_9VIRU|nr:GrBNV_gp67-like protein [Oryctes rhinoceros nudivirus]QKE59492.1 GrBNV_gp67-like protein [Oryctes rhinoceros nudivirus]UBO76439.1 GrBNV_gp67-like protein [Oryctes rhinoceros nudivirus]UBR58200.1 gp67-like protein [Oryctes rhinoceros nudivirus]WAQ80025.1 GrBNV_gp67-like protein [Oryctes rhinoceros nudivirus]